jgi:hypothetical protein
MQAFIVSVGCSLAAFILTVIVSFVRAPKLLDDQRVVQIRSLTKPARSAVEEWRFQIVKTSAEKHGEGALRLLRHLRIVGKMIFQAGGPILPPGMSQSITQELLKVLRLECIVEQEDITPVPSEPLHNMLNIVGHKRVWRIIPEMEEAVDELLNAC